MSPTLQVDCGGMTAGVEVEVVVATVEVERLFLAAYSLQKAVSLPPPLEG